MHTLIYEVYRDPEWTQERFISHWHEIHRPLALQIPLVRGYRFCPVVEAAAVEGDEVAGFLIFEFDSKEDSETARASPEFAAIGADALDNFALRFTRYEVEVIDATG
jgi:uncharacterized protein (TIGR02118 family)